MGLTEEYDLYLWTMRLPALSLELGGAGGHEAALARARWVDAARGRGRAAEEARWRDGVPRLAAALRRGLARTRPSSGRAPRCAHGSPRTSGRWRARMTGAGDEEYVAFQRWWMGRLREAGYLAPHVPKRWGGAGARWPGR